MMDDLTPYLSPDVASILRAFQPYDSMEAFRSDHPEITDEMAAKVTIEVARAMEAFLKDSQSTKPPAKRKKKDSSSGNAYQLKITLRGSKPPIWRRVAVPAEITLASLHDVIQVAMGWFDCHLHRFEIDGRPFQRPDPDGYYDGMDYEDESKYRLCDVVRREKAKFRYEYDFGDSWEHLIVVEKIIPAADKPKMMVCMGGKGNCPLEDSGGLWGYYNKLEILANPKHPEYEEIREWMGEDHDPNDFDPDEISKDLAKLKR